MPQGKQRSNKPKKHDQKDRKKGNAKNKSKQSNKQKQAKLDLYDPRTSLTGDDLKKFVKSEVRQQTRPQISANKRTVKSLKQLLSSQTGQLKDFDKQASRNIGSYYDDLAQSDKQATAISEALGARLTGELASQGGQTAQTIQSGADASTAALAADSTLRGDPNSPARSELQQIIAMQQGNAATESQALQGKGAAQSNTWTNLMQGLGQANQMRGAASLADIHQGTKESISDLQNQYAPDIREALGQIRDTRKSKGDLRNQLLQQLRGDERQYLLSKGALGVDKGSLKIDQAAAAKSKSGNPTLDVAKQYGINKKREQVRSLQNQLKVVQAQSDAASKRQAESLQSQLKVANRQLKAALAKQKASTNSQLKVNKAQQGKGGKLSEYDKPDRQRAVNIARGAGSLSFINGNKQQVIAEMGRRYGVNPVLARWAVNKILKKHKAGSQSNTDFYDSHPLG